MSTMNISLPESLRGFAEKQVERGAYGSTSEYVRALIRRDRDRVELRERLEAGAGSPPGAAADRRFFDDLRARVEREQYPHRNK